MGHTCFYMRDFICNGATQTGAEIIFLILIAHSKLFRHLALVKTLQGIMFAITGVQKQSEAALLHVRVDEWLCDIVYSQPQAAVGLLAALPSVL